MICYVENRDSQDRECAFALLRITENAVIAIAKIITAPIANAYSSRLDGAPARVHSLKARIVREIYIRLRC